MILDPGKSLQAASSGGLRKKINYIVCQKFFLILAKYLQVKGIFFNIYQNIRIGSKYTMPIFHVF